MTETKQTLFKNDDEQSRRDELIDTVTAAIVAAIAADWLTLPGQVRFALENAALSGAAQGILDVEAADASLLTAGREAAEKYGLERSASLVGMMRDGEGNLVPDEDAEWAISTTSADKIRRIVADAFSQNAELEDVKAAIQGALQEETEGHGIFSDARAELVARNEIAVAQSRGHYQSWAKSGVIKRVRWVVLSDNPCSECSGLDGSEFELGDIENKLPPRHPHCMCIVEVSD